MQPVVGPAAPHIDMDRMAELLWSSDPKLNEYIYQSSSVLRRIIKAEWPEDRGLLCHKQALTAVSDGSLLGLLVGHTTVEYAANFEASLTLQTKDMSQGEIDHLTAGIHWMDRLFPEGRDGSYYILELSTMPEARGQGLASLLLNAAEERARTTGCRAICLDVAADNAAVDFYRNRGFETEIETKVPFLELHHGIGTHLHMVKSIGEPE